MFYKRKVYHCIFKVSYFFDISTLRISKHTLSSLSKKVPRLPYRGK